MCDIMKAVSLEESINTLTLEHWSCACFILGTEVHSTVSFFVYSPYASTIAVCRDLFTRHLNG